MFDGGRGERKSIKNNGGAARQYGSTSKHVKPQHYVLHQVTNTDTLQGIALKYNTSTEQIRRVNRLYASESLFLRDALKIPVPREVAVSHNNNGTDSSLDSKHIASSTSTDSFSDDDEKSASDFLGKIDSAIASTRAQVKHVQQNSHFVDAHDPTMVRRHQKPRQPASLQTTPCDDVPQAYVLNHDRNVRNSLQRLQQEQDDMFLL